VTVTPPPSPINGVTIRATGSMSAYMSAVAMNPAVAAQVVRLGFMRDAALCSGNPDGFAELSIGQGSFIPFVVGSSSGLYMRGAVIGNLLILCGAVLVVFLVALVLGRSLRDDGGAFPFRLALQRVHCPSIFHAGVLVLMSGIVNNSVSLAFLPTDGAKADNVLLCLLGCILSLVYCIWVTVILLHRFPCRLEVVSDARGKKRRGKLGETTIGAWFFYLNEPTVRWAPRTPEFLGWKRHNSMFFNDCRFAWFSLMELWSTFAFAALNGVNSTSTSFCTSQLGLILAFSVVQCSVGFIMRPMTTRIAGACQNALNILSAFVASLMIAGFATSNDATILLCTYIQLLALLLAMLKMVFDLVCCMISVGRWVYRHFARKKKQGRYARQAPRPFEEAVESANHTDDVDSNKNNNKGVVEDVRVDVSRVDDDIIADGSSVDDIVGDGASVESSHDEVAAAVDGDECLMECLLGETDVTDVFRQEEPADFDILRRLAREGALARSEKVPPNFEL